MFGRGSADLGGGSPCTAESEKPAIATRATTSAPIALRSVRGTSCLPDLPDVLSGIVPRPFQGRVVAVGGGRVGGRTKLDEILDREPAGSEEPDPIAVRELPLDGSPARIVALRPS